MNKKRISSFLLACALMLSATACGGGNAQTASGTTASSDAAVSQDGAAKTSVTIACAAEPDCFFPFHSTLGTNMDEVPILHNIYETPIRLERDGTHTPLLATKWEISPDGKEYKLFLRDDVYFHSGNKMTAEDVAWTLNTAAPSNGGQAQLANFETCEVVDETTVLIKLSAPYGPFLNALCGRYALIADKKLFDEIGEDAYNENPVGTGPYKWVSRTSGDRVVLTANDSYWGGAPAIKDVTYRVMGDTNTQMISLENGDIDVLIQANVGALTKLNTDRVKWETSDASSICMMYINCAKGPGADPLFRQALQYGINKEEVNIGVYEGYGTIGDIQLPESFSGRPEKGTYKVVDYNLEKAKELLAKSSYKGEEFSIATVSGTRNENAAQVVQGQLIELGINCTINAVDAPSYNAIEKEGSFGAKIRAGGISVMDADGLYFQYHTSQILKPGNYDMGICSPEMDKLLETGRVEVDAAKRKQIYGQACDIITDNAYGVCLYYEVNACAYNSSIKGVVPHALTGLYYFNDWSW